MALTAERRAFIFRMKDGQRILDLDPAGLRWGLRLNKGGTIDLDIRVGADDVDAAAVRTYTKPKKYGIALAHGSKIIEAGHITGRTWADDGGSVSITVVGLWTYLEWLKVFSENFNRRTGDPKADQFTLSGMTLAGIAGALIRTVVNNPHEADTIPPITTDQAAQPGAHTRTYFGKDFANLAQRLTELTGVAGGPDQAFIPEFVDSTEQAIRWRHTTGTEAQPLLMQDGAPHIFDMTVPKSIVTAAGVDEDGTSIATRVWSQGTGDGAGIATGENTLLVEDGYPLLEANGSYDTSDAGILTKYNDQAILDASTTTGTWSIALRMEDPTELRPGDFANVYTKGHKAVTDGVHLVRIVGIDGDHSTALKLSIQPMLTDWASFDPMKIQRRYIEPDPVRREAEAAAAPASLGSLGGLGGGSAAGKIGTIADPPGESGAARVIFDGETEASPDRYAYLDTYTPTPTDRVILAPFGKDSLMVILGRVVGLPVGETPDLYPGTHLFKSLQPSALTRANTEYSVAEPGDQGAVWQGLYAQYNNGEFIVQEPGRYEIEAQLTLKPVASPSAADGSGQLYAALYLMVLPAGDYVPGNLLAEEYFGPTSDKNTAQTVALKAPIAGQPTTFHWKREIDLKVDERFGPKYTSNFFDEGADISPEASYLKIRRIG